MSSERSFKTSGDDTEQSFSKRNRLSQIITPPNRNASSGSSTNQPETDQLILGESTKDTTNDESSSPNTQTQPPSKLSLNLSQSTATANPSATSQPSTSDTSNAQIKNMSKAAVLRHLFFSQISSNANATDVASSKETN